MALSSFRALPDIFRQHVSWPVEPTIAKVNPVLRGWVSCFSAEEQRSFCFAEGSHLGAGPPVTMT
jgi:hypothetical protein